MSSTWLTVREAGELSSMGERFIRRMVAERKLRYAKVGRFIRIEASELDAFMRGGTVDPLPRRK